MLSFHYRAEITAHTYSYRFWNAERKRILCHGNAITRNTYGRGVNMTSKCSLSCNYNQYCRHTKWYHFKNNMTLICQLNLDCNSIHWCKNFKMGTLFSVRYHGDPNTRRVLTVQPTHPTATKCHPTSIPSTQYPFLSPDIKWPAYHNLLLLLQH